MSQHENRREKRDPDEIKEILGAVSSEAPALIRNVLSSVFSKEAGGSMGKAAAAYYKELKDGGLPEQAAVKMTEDYMRTFTSVGEMLRSAGGAAWSHGEGAEIGRKIKENIDREFQNRNEEE